MKHLFSSFLLTLTVITLNGQPGTFTRGYGLGVLSGSHYFEHTSDGGYIVFSSWIYGPSANNLDHWAYIAKLTASGDTQWVKKCLLYTGLKFGEANSICETYDGGYMLATDYDSLDTTSNNWIRSVYLIKLDSNGALAWSQLYRLNSNSYSTCIRKTSDHGFVICGKIGNNQNTGGFVIRLDSVGAVQWSRSYTLLPAPSGYPETFNSIYETQNGDFIVCGEHLMMRLDSQGNIIWSKTNALTISNKDIREMENGDILCIGYDFQVYSTNVYRMDSAGNSIWSVMYTGSLGLIPGTLVPTWDGFTYAAHGTPTDPAGVRLNHMDHSGNWIWTYEYYMADGGGADMTRTSDGGYAFSTLKVDIASSTGNQVLVSKVDSSGIGACFGDLIVEFNAPIADPQPANFSVSSYTSTQTIQTITSPFPEYDSVYCFVPDAMEELNPQIEHIELFPNPATDMITVKIAPAGFDPIRLRIYNSLGQVVLEEKLFSSLATVNLATISSGLYFIEISIDGEPSAQRKFIKE